MFACGRREERRRRTERDIHLCALRLTDERGLDGFTLDELADASGVARRTLFNYFPSKADAVLGPRPGLPDDTLATFAAGGPTGDLVEDVVALSTPLLHGLVLPPEVAMLVRRVVMSEPRLIAAAHERFEEVSALLAPRMLQRFGARPGADRGPLLVRVLGVVFDTALLSMARDDGPPELARAFADHLRDLRDLLA